ncbi:MAG: Eco29kI family restriction endonuclease [Dehalococcoidia bacterium]
MCDQHEFQFEFDKAYNHQLIEKFEASPEHLLEPGVAPRLKGVYALYRNGRIVYAGKALGSTTLAGRLGDHNRKVSGRKGIDPAEVTCRFVIIGGDWFVRAAEDALIQHYQPEWQGSGFGRHAPGGGRPGKHPSKWETQYPLAD